MSFTKSQPKSHFLILYASETGQAKAISEEIFEKASEYGLKPARFCMSLIDKRVNIFNFYISLNFYKTYRHVGKRFEYNRLMINQDQIIQVTN